MTSAEMGSHRRAEKGVTFVELVIVVVVLTIVSALVMPDIMNTIYGVRLRSSAHVLAGMLQATRMRAVKDNKYYYLRSRSVQSSTILWITNQAAETEPQPEEQQAQLSGTVRLVMTGNPGDPTLDFTPIRNSSPMFNSHGLPCALNGAACANVIGADPVGYQLYLTDSHALGADGWATVIVAPGGRIQVYFYNGSSWGN